MIIDGALNEMEEKAASVGDQMSQWVCQLVSEVRRLKHELVDPNYLYANGRIHRQAVVSRNAEIEKLKAECKARTFDAKLIPELPENHESVYDDDMDIGRCNYDSGVTVGMLRAHRKAG